MLESWHEAPATAGETRIDRRQLLTVGGALVGAAAAHAQVATVDSSTPRAHAPAAGSTVVLQDRRLVLPRDVLGRLTGHDVQLLTLEPDPVRMWRGAHAHLLGHASTRLLGVTPWIEFVMIQGLAAESRRRVRYQRHDAGSDAMVWLIA